MALEAVDYEELARIQGRRADGDPEATEELIALGKRCDSDLWALVAGILSTEKRSTVEGWIKQAERHFAELEPAAKVRFVDPKFGARPGGLFELHAPRFDASMLEASCLRDIHVAAFEIADELSYESGAHEEGFDAFCQASFARRLTAVDLAASGLTPRSGEHFGAQDFSNLRRLSFYWEDLAPAGIVAVMQNPSLHHLDELSFDFCATDAEAWQDEALADLDNCACAFAGRLRTLRLKSCSIPAETLEQLCRNERLLGGLIRLDFGNEDGGEGENLFGDEGAKILASCPHLAGLKYLGLGQCGLSDEGLESIVGSEALAGLETLDLGCRIGAGLDFSDDLVERARERFGRVIYV